MLQEIDSRKSARHAGLRYINDSGPGIERIQAEKMFTYYDPEGKQIQDQGTLARINALRIPPAWKNVWVSPVPESHLQATGRDAKNRKQYIYHALWRKERSEDKFHLMIPFGLALPDLRASIELDLKQPCAAKEKVLALVVKLLEITLIRVGNREYERLNNSYGLTTMHHEHLVIKEELMKFHFLGKRGKEHIVEINDPRIARIISQCGHLPGQELFRYLDQNGRFHSVDSADVNEYIKAKTGHEFTAKDFRTWGGTTQAAVILNGAGPSISERATMKRITEAVKLVAQKLGNKPATCRKYYIHPVIFDAYQEQRLFAFFEKANGSHIPKYQRPEEAAVLDILQSLESGDAK